MKIRDAMLCLDCDELSLQATHCPVCTSGSVVELARWLPPLDQPDGTRAKAEHIMRELQALRNRLERIGAVECDEPLGCGA